MDNLKEILKDLKKSIKKNYGNNLRKIILYGSYARKDETQDSDIDILVVLNDFDNVYSEILHLSPIVSEISLKYDTL